MPARRIAGRIYEEVAVRAVDPVPVDIQGATLSLTANGVEIKNDVGNPIPVNDAGGSLTIDNANLTSIDGKLPALVNGKVPVDASVSISGGATEAKQDTGNTSLGNIDADLGAKADAAASTDTGTFSVIALIKRGLQNWTTLLARIPALSNGKIPIDIQQGGGAITATTTRVTLATDGPGVANLSSIAGLSIPAHDYIALSYTGTNLTGVVYKTGGSGGTTVGTLTLAYSGSQLTSVTKS